MNRARWCMVVALVAAAGFTLYAVQRRAQFNRAAPSWLDPEQPSDGVASELSTLTDAQSWAANRCTPMSQCTAGRTAGMRIRREYPGTLADSPTSIVRGRLSLDAKVNI